MEGLFMANCQGCGVKVTVFNRGMDNDWCNDCSVKRMKEVSDSQAALTAPSEEVTTAKEETIANEEKPMYCRNCGSQLSRNTTICTNCGVRPLLEKKYCQECGVETQSNQAMCIKCGALLGSSMQTAYGKLIDDDFSSYSKYYQDEFNKIYSSNETYKGKWNWFAFFFGPIWALIKGLWLSALIAVLASWLISGLVGLVYCFIFAVRGNYMYYSNSIKNKQLPF